MLILGGANEGKGSLVSYLSPSALDSSSSGNSTIVPSLLPSSLLDSSNGFLADGTSLYDLDKPTGSSNLTLLLFDFLPASNAFFSSISDFSNSSL